MKKNTINSKKGFTLLETMVVVFIITVITSATAIAVSECIKSARIASDRMSSRESIMESIMSDTNSGDTCAGKPIQ
ncbi:MAG: type II secretion system GspH family protein [Clostridia bacterium]|nr:type II secretion system GspH family protein [Clostridia bacterium]